MNSVGREQIQLGMRKLNHSVFRAHKDRIKFLMQTNHERETFLQLGMHEIRTDQRQLDWYFDTPPIIFQNFHHGRGPPNTPSFFRIFTIFQFHTRIG